MERMLTVAEQGVKSRACGPFNAHGDRINRQRQGFQVLPSRLERLERVLRTQLETDCHAALKLTGNRSNGNPYSPLKHDDNQQGGMAE